MFKKCICCGGKLEESEKEEGVCIDCLYEEEMDAKEQELYEE